MRDYFNTILNMSLTATYVAIAVMAVRLLIKKAPKIFSYSLWAVVLFRLVSPVSFRSSFSLMGKVESLPVTEAGIGIFKNAVNGAVPMPLTQAGSIVSTNPAQIAMDIAAAVWLLGIAVLLCYGALSYFRLKKRLATATLLEENIFETDLIKTPFVLGFINPKIYIPTGLDEKELDYILKHEQTHIKRLDYLIKPAAFLALTLHWFNPVMWLSYILMARDMEMSCDESVMKQSRVDIRASYSSSLLSLSVRQSGLLSPLAFGESNVKSRIKNVLSYKKPTFWIMASALVAVAVLTALLMANPSKAAPKENYPKARSVESFAWEVIDGDIKVFESNPEVKIIDSKIIRLEMIEKFEILADKPIEVYELEFALKPEDLSKVALAGGMYADEKGWLMDTYGMGNPLLIVYRSGDSYEFIGTLTTGGVIEDGGLEASIKSLLSRNSTDPQNNAETENLNINYIETTNSKRFLEKQTDLLALPADNAVKINIIFENTVVDVLETGVVNNVVWLHVSIPVYDTPIDNEGWIREADTVLYTKDMQNKVQGDVKVKVGSDVYEVDNFEDIKSTAPSKAVSGERGRIQERKGDFIRLECPGGRTIWVKEASIIYPELD